MYPREDVTRFIEDHFLPVKVHIKEQPGTFGRFHKRWTPTLAVLDPRGVERHAFVGYLPSDEFLAQLALGLGQVEFGAGRWESAAARFDEAADTWPDAAAAPEAVYWAGVARYKETEDPASLQETSRELSERYTNSTWATRASVWAG